MILAISRQLHALRFDDHLGAANAVGMRIVLLVGLLAAACGSGREEFVPRGPGELLPTTDAKLSDLMGIQSDDVAPAARTVATVPSDVVACDAACQSHCDGLGLSHPINRAMCNATWGIGLETTAIDTREACRRLHVDLIGRFPTADEAAQHCDGRAWSVIAAELIQTDAFVNNCQRDWAETLRLNSVAAGVDSVVDLGNVIERMCRGTLGYDAFAAITASHPAIMRLYDTPEDRAEVVFQVFLGRPPFENERTDFGRMYAVWGNDYVFDRSLGMQLPAAWVKHVCADEAGAVDASRGCTSVLWGHHPVSLTPDIRVSKQVDNVDATWSGVLTAEEWHVLQTPGRVLASLPLFWEQIVDRVLERYLGYAIGQPIPAVRAALTQQLIDSDGDLRALHQAVVTSLPYLQSHAAPDVERPNWTVGPFKQTLAETWIDSIEAHAQVSESRCDPLVTDPSMLDESLTPASYALLESSGWSVSESGRVDQSYAELARTLGGCPSQQPTSRFSIVSILTTGVQLSFAAESCGVGEETDESSMRSRIGVESLLPSGTTPDALVTPALAEMMLDAQVRSFLGREPDATERAAVRDAGEACERQRCTAETFARPLCYSLLSSSEHLFY